MAKILSVNIRPLSVLISLCLHFVLLAPSETAEKIATRAGEEDILKI